MCLFVISKGTMARQGMRVGHGEIEYRCMAGEKR